MQRQESCINGIYMDRADVYWRCTEKKVAGFSMEILPHVCPACLWVEIEEVMAGWLVPWPAMCFTSTADNKIGRERLKCTWFSKVHSIQHHVYPFFPKETRRWCPDDVVVVWLRWPHRFGQIAASKVGERKRPRFAASKKTASDVLFQKLFRFLITHWKSHVHLNWGEIHMDSSALNLTWHQRHMNSFATWTFLRWGPFFFSRPHLPVECESMWIGQPVSFVVNHAAPKAPWERTFGIFELNPVGFSTFF